MDFNSYMTISVHSRFEEEREGRLQAESEAAALRGTLSELQERLIKVEWTV